MFDEEDKEEADFFDTEEEYVEDLDSTIYLYLLYYKGAFYPAECVEVTPDTAYFQVDAEYVRKGMFPQNRLDFRYLREMGIELKMVHQQILTEQ